MAILTTRDVKGAGFAIPRPDGAEKVTGRTKYVADLNPRGLLHAKLLRCPHAHAKIVRIDTSKAKALPGVRAVLTAADIPEQPSKPPTRAHAVLAIGRVVFSGQPVAAVAADELAIAEEALDLIEVEYEPLPAAVDSLAAMRADAPLVAEEGTEQDASEALAHSGIAVQPSTAQTEGNVTQRSHFSKGDVAAGFAESDVVLERTYRVPMVHQGYLEPHAVLAEWDTTGLLTLWASTQGIFTTRAEVADVLGIPETRVRVVPMECGGGFGAKIRALCEPITALLARETGRPVRYVMTRREELEAGMPAPQMVIRLKTGVKRDGSLLALEAETVIDAGAFAGAVLTMNAVFLGTLYRWPSYDIRGAEVLTHKPGIAAYRAPTSPQTMFALDSQMAQLARQLGLDPVEFRMRHLHDEGDPMAHGQPWQPNGIRAVLRAVAEHPFWKERDAWQAVGGKNGRGPSAGPGGTRIWSGTARARSGR
jgi:CO/xanthine dehydrogenase Mo-binding subunit